MTTIQLSERVQRVKPSATIAVSTLAREMRAAGRDVLSLSAGEPDFDTPEHVRAAAAEAMEAGDTRYTAADGTPALKQAICRKFERDNGLAFEPSQITVGAGAKQVLYNVCAAVLNPGDEAIVLAPYWVSYPDIVKLCDGEPVVVSAGLDAGYKVTPEQVEDGRKVLDTLADERGRDPGSLTISVFGRAPETTRQEVDDFLNAGALRVCVWPTHCDTDQEMGDQLERMAETLVR